MVAHLHSLKRNIERGWEEKDLGFLQDHDVIWLVLGRRDRKDWVERNFFSMTVFSGNLLAGDVHSSVTMDGHVQAWQWIGNISLLTWGLLSASACSLEAWGRNSVSLEKCVSWLAEWWLSGYWKSLAAGPVLSFSYYFTLCRFNLFKSDVGTRHQTPCGIWLEFIRLSIYAQPMYCYTTRDVHCYLWLQEKMHGKMSVQIVWRCTEFWKCNGEEC